eukprot:gb/GFBE01022235.1/.p1 GENE.gb/GFBE01022235.1/~~gb/GFBE01022235.1/.p1  ORF type:complete len:585 (+),score=108.13 gb/GFBE01022235.1/:1-1755(+)
MAHPLVAVWFLLLRHAYAQYSADQSLREAIAAASVVRIVGEYNTDPSCQWPECAPVCEACPQTKMGGCFVPGVDECAWNSQCIMGSCFCGKGYCPKQGQCAWRTCSYGAKPPAYEASSTAKRLASFAPIAPGVNGTRTEWKEYALTSAKWPAVLCALGILIAFGTLVCVCCELEFEPEWMPKSPVVIISLCAVTVVIIVIGVTTRGSVVSSSMALAKDQIGRMDQSIDQAVQLAAQLEQMTQSFEVTVQALPSSCRGIPGASNVMTTAADKANEKLQEMKQKVDAFSKMSALADKYITMMKDQFSMMQVLLVYLPMVPLLLMMLSILAIGIAAMISCYSKNPEVAERADDCVIRFGSVGSCIIMVVAVIQVSIYSLASVSTASVCVDLDQNVIGLFTSVNFTELSHYKYNIDPIMEGAAKYYILGSQENPMITMIQEVANDAMALYTVYTNATWATGPAAAVCPGVHELDAQTALRGCQESVAFATELLRAKNMYPYYKTFGQELVCEKMLTSMSLLILFTGFVSFICLPLISCCADVDLRKWENQKQRNYGTHYDPESRHEQEMPILGGRQARDGSSFSGYHR